MVCKEEIYMWFKESTSSQRIDLLCGLLHLCLPLELRFLGTCLEDLARKDYAALRDYEVKANKLSEYSAVQSIVTSDGSLENRLNIYMSLLHSTNVVCANSLFHMLLQIFESVKNIFSNESMCDDVRTVPLICQCEVSENLLLLFTLAAYHPAFVFSQRLRLFEILSKVVQLIKCNSCDKVVPDAGPTVHLPASRNVCTESSHTLDVELPGKISNEVYVTSIELKQKTQNSDGYHIKVLFSSNEVAEVLKTYNQLKDFHTQLDSSLSLIAAKVDCHKEAVALPKFSTCELPQNYKQVTDSLKSYFRDFMTLPSNISHNPEVTRVFRDFLNLPSTDSLAESSLELAQQSSREPSTVEDVDKPELLSNGRSFEEESIPTVTRGSPRATSCTGNTRIRKSSSCLCDQPTIVPSPSKSLPLLASPQNQRSRQTSPRGEGNDVAAWLKDIRLHKYTDSLAKYSWNQLLCLSDEELQYEGLTDGARKKFMTEIHLIRSGQKPGIESSPGLSSQSQIWRTSCRSPNVKSSIPISGLDSPACGGSPHREFFFPESNDVKEKGARQLLGCKQQQITNDCNTIDSTKSMAARISSDPRNHLLAFVMPDCTMSHQVTTVASSPCILPAQTLPTAMHYLVVDQKLPPASCLSSRWPRPAKSLSASIISGGLARPFYNMYSSTVPFRNESQNLEYKFPKLASDSVRKSPFGCLGINAVIENETSTKSSLTSLSSSTLVNSVRSASLTSATCQPSPSISCAFDVPPPLSTLPVCSSQNGGLFPYNSTPFTTNSNASNCLIFIPDNLQKASVSTSTMPLVDSRPVDVTLLSSLPYPPAFYAFPPPSIPGAAVPVIPGLPYCAVTHPPIQPANVTANTLHHPTEYLPPPQIPPCCQQPPPATGQGLYNPFPWPGPLFTAVPTNPCFNIAGNLVPPPPYDIPPPPLPLQPRLPAHCPAPYRLVVESSQEVQYQTTYTMTVSGPRQPTISVPPPVNPTSLSSNTAHLQPPYQSHSGSDTSSSTVPSCANCGKSGHQHLECTEWTADNTTMNTAQFRLNLNPKAESI